MQKEEKNFRSYYDEEEESHDYFDINDCYDYEGNFDYDRLEDAIMEVCTSLKIGTFNNIQLNIHIMVTANRQNGTFKLRKCLWNGINKSFGGDTSKTITSVRCFEYKDGVQDLFINYFNSYSK